MHLPDDDDDDDASSLPATASKISYDMCELQAQRQGHSLPHHGADALRLDDDADLTVSIHASNRREHEHVPTRIQEQAVENKEQCSNNQTNVHIREAYL